MGRRLLASPADLRPQPDACGLYELSLHAVPCHRMALCELAWRNLKGLVEAFG